MDPILLGKINKLNSNLTDLTNKTWSDFLNSNTGTPWSNNLVASGTISATGSAINHDGILQFKSSTNANSGSGVFAKCYGFFIKGLEKTTFIFKTASLLTGITRRMGFHDSFDINDTANGIYGEIIDGVLKGKTARLNVRTLTTTSYTLSANTWYRFVIQVNKDASQITYTLYADNSNIVLWTDTISTNIPTATSGVYVTANGDICIYSGTTAIEIGILDYVDIILPNRRIV